MLRRVYTSLLTALFFVMANSAYAMRSKSSIERDTTQRVTIRFDYRWSEVDSKYATNEEAIEWLDAKLRDSLTTSLVNEVKIVSYLSPQGHVKFESWLAAMRTATVNDFLKQRYPYLNKAVVCTLQVSNGAEMEQAMSMDRDLNRAEIEISFRCPTKLSTGKESKLNVDINTFSVNEARRLIEREYAPAPQVAQSEQRTVLALKNNLLYDLALAPNLEVELPIGKHWSLNAEYKCPWWLNGSKDFCYQLLSGGIETRYWLGKRKHSNRLIGHFLGLYAEGGVYDLQFGGSGYQGKYYGASGLTYGYVKQIAPSLALEFSLGVGYLTTEYRKYTPYKNDLIWTNSGRYNFLGPTKAKVSLVWLITTRR